jgi:hypothetical protein
MSYISPQGRVYTLSDLERLTSIDTFGQYTGAIKGLIQRTKFLERENESLRKMDIDAESYKSQLLQLRAEINSLKK